jgi:hypothetical protein
MQRRTFITASLAAGALSGVSGAAAVPGSQNASGAQGGKSRLFYELRRYQLSNGPQKKLCDDFFQGAFPPLTAWASSPSEYSISPLVRRRLRYTRCCLAPRWKLSSRWKHAWPRMRNM